MKRNDDALNRIISRFERAWRAEAKEAIYRLYELLDSGMKVEAAVIQLRKEHLGLFRLSGLEDALIEATAYGYGIMPEVLANADRNAIINAVSQPWSADGMTLSEKLHGADRAIHKAIQDTVQQQYNKNATVMEMARTLYDGYQSEVAVVLKPEELPKYMHKVERNLGATREECKDIEKALKNINKLAQNGAPNKALKTAYNELVEAVESGNDKAVQRAVNTALEEKARYIAERIARTESARAYADGFFSKHQDDKDVVAYEIELSTRHPVFDICDMYTQCNMFNLGKGVYPKDKVPIVPLHPHCLCKYKAIIDGKVDMDKMRNQQNQEMVRWANSLSDLQAKMVLGVQGYSDFKAASKALNKSNSETGTNTRIKDVADVIRRTARSYTSLQHPRYRIINLDGMANFDELSYDEKSPAKSPAEIKKMTQNGYKLANKYLSNESKWSGNIVIDNSIDIPCGKAWNCDIVTKDNVSQSMLLHEQIHAHSCSYFSKKEYFRFSGIEEGSVEYLTKQICKAEKIPYYAGYQDLVKVMENAYQYTSFKSELKFAQHMVEVPLTERLRWLEKEVRSNAGEHTQDALQNLAELIKQKAKR